MILLAKDRILSIDMFRALCALVIIAYWHMGDYVFVDSIIMNNGYNLAIISLSGFSFISGLLNGNKSKSWKVFYLSRLQRFYIPFVISYISLIIIGLNLFSFKHLLYTLTGLSGFTHYQPYTLWFISDLMFYYILTPFIIQKDRIKRSIVLLLLTVLYYLLIHNDYRLSMYLFFYLVGLNLKPSDVMNFHYPNWFILLSIITIIFTFGISGNTNPLAQTFIGLMGVPLFLYISNYITKSKVFSSLLYSISYSSMFAYFYHRFICFYLDKYTTDFGVSDIIKFPTLILAVFIFSIILQKGYDYLLKYVIAQVIQRRSVCVVESNKF